MYTYIYAYIYICIHIYLYTHVHMNRIMCIFRYSSASTCVYIFLT